MSGRIVRRNCQDGAAAGRSGDGEGEAGLVPQQGELGQDLGAGLDGEHAGTRHGRRIAGRGGAPGCEKDAVADAEIGDLRRGRECGLAKRQRAAAGEIGGELAARGTRQSKFGPYAHKERAAAGDRAQRQRAAGRRDGAGIGDAAGGRHAAGAGKHPAGIDLHGARRSILRIADLDGAGRARDQRAARTCKRDRASLGRAGGGIEYAALPRRAECQHGANGQRAPIQRDPSGYPGRTRSDRRTASERQQAGVAARVAYRQSCERKDAGKRHRPWPPTQK